MTARWYWNWHEIQPPPVLFIITTAPNVTINADNTNATVR